MIYRSPVGHGAVGVRLVMNISNIEKAPLVICLSCILGLSYDIDKLFI